MVITMAERSKGIRPFGVFHTSLGPTLCTESELKSDLTVEKVPSLDKSSLDVCAEKFLKVLSPHLLLLIP
jgi:hypothetical protein